MSQALIAEAIALRDAYEAAKQVGDDATANAIAPSFSAAISALAEMGMGIPTGDGKGTWGPSEGETGEVSVSQDSDGSRGVTATNSTGVAAPSAPPGQFSLGLDLGQAPAAPTMSRAESAAALRGASKAGASFVDGDNEMESANSQFYSTDEATPGIRGAADAAREAVATRDAQIAQNEEKVAALEQMNIESERDNATFNAISEAAGARDANNAANANANAASAFSAGHTMSNDYGASSADEGNAFAPGGEQLGSDGGILGGTFGTDGQGNSDNDTGSSFGGTSTGNGFTEAQTSMPGSYSNEMESANSAFVDAAVTGVGDENGATFGAVQEGRGNFLDNTANAFAPAGEQLGEDGSFLDGSFSESGRGGSASGGYGDGDGDGESSNEGGLTGGFSGGGYGPGDGSNSQGATGAASAPSNSGSFNGNAFSGDASGRAPAVAGFSERSGDDPFGEGSWGNAFGSWGDSAFGGISFGESPDGAWGGGWGSDASFGDGATGAGQGGW